VIIDAFITACSLNQATVVKKRISTWSSQGTLSTNLSRLDLDGRSAVNVSVQSNNLLVLLLLIKAGVDLKSPDPTTGQTPLHVGCKWGCSDCIRSLLDHPGGLSCINQPDLECGDTPLHLVVKNGHLECLRILRGHMPDPFVDNHQLLTPLACGLQSRNLRRRENESLYEYVRSYRYRVSNLIFLTCKRLGLGELEGSRVCSFLLAKDESVKEFEGMGGRVPGNV